MKSHKRLFFRWWIKQIWIISGIILLLFSCEKERFFTGDSGSLKFSCDTVMFDTVFTTIGSTTKHFQVINPYNKALKISEIYLAGKESSNFRLNIDGVKALQLENIELPAGDSLYIFVEVTVDPQNQNSPLVVKDSVVFITNGNFQDIDLIAWGQDVHLINGGIIQTQTWINDKPYLVYNSMLIDSMQKLTLDPGVRVHFHRNSTMYIMGNLEIHGTVEEPVIFQGDRLESEYAEIPGQWGGLYFLNGSVGNVIEYLEIRNGTTGLHLGNLYSEKEPANLTISNSIITQMNFAGISAINAKIDASNCVIANCGFYGIALTTGGEYEFNHCTVSNNWRYFNRSTPTVLITNYYNLNDTALFTGELEMATFGNCIIYGDMETEIGFDMIEGVGSFQYYFDHCLIKVDDSEIDVSDPMSYNNIFINNAPGFIAADSMNFHLDSCAFVLDKGSQEIGMRFPNDILGNSRINDSGPDIGAYERLEDY